MTIKTPAITAMVLLAAVFTQSASAASDLDKSAAGFKKLDLDNNGFISRKEAKSNSDIEDSFSEADSNNDGMLSMTEYESMEVDE